MALVDDIIRYEDGEMEGAEYMRFFAELIRTGMAWELQGSLYGRPANELIKNGLISQQGNITVKGKEWIEANS